LERVDHQIFLCGTRQHRKLAFEEDKDVFDFFALLNQHGTFAKGLSFTVGSQPLDVGVA
jgi:hypothetical protein